MKLITVKARYVRLGLILIIITAGFGGCGDAPPVENEGTSIGYKTGDMVSVRVDVPKTLQQSNSGRSVLPEGVRVLVDTYEVLFKSTGGAYYRGEGTSAQGYVSVSVPVGNGYEVLLLAGRDKTLLAAAYLGVKNKTADADNPYPNNDGPVDILAGRLNRIVITLNPIPLQVWNSDDTTNDLRFASASSVDDVPTTTSYLAKQNRYVQIQNPVLVVEFRPQNVLAPLYNANVQDGLLSIEAYKVTLLPRYPAAKGGLFNSIVLTNGVGSDFTVAKGASIRFYNTDSLPQNADGLLHFELTYHAFGTKDSTGMAWTIRNGLDYSEDSVGTYGGGIVVVLGDGFPGGDTEVTPK